MLKFPTSLGNAPVNPEGEKGDWKIKTASNGLLFYFNTKTKKSQWEKPEVLKTAEERLNSTDWQEHTTAEGKAFYYNAKLKQSVWKMPPELKAIKEKQAELRRQSGQPEAAGGPKINISINSSLPHLDNPQDDVDPYENLSHEEAVRVFKELLRDRVTPSMKWEQALPLIKNDDRMRVIKGIGEQRRIFKDWINETKQNEKQESRLRVQRARENFRRMLEDKNVLTSDSKYYKVFHLFMTDYRWKDVDERDKEQTFQDYLDDLFEKEKEERNKQIKHHREELRNQLMRDSTVTPSTKWDDICQMYKDNPIWVELPEYDRIQVFSKWIIELDQQEHENKRKLRRTQERKNREAFGDLLKEHIDRGTLTYKSKWRHFIHQIKDDKRLYEMLGQYGSTPRELFEEQVDLLKDQHKRTKDDFKKLIKESGLKFTSETLYKDFDSSLRGKEEFEKLDLKTRDYFYNYFLEKAKSKEKESSKKQRRNAKRFLKFLKSLPNIKSDSDYKDFEQIINENEASLVLSEAERRSNFETFTKELKNRDEGQIIEEDAEKQKKKKNRRKKKNKKRNYDSSDDEDGRGDSSDDSRRRSESKSRSRSGSKEHRKKKKDRKKTTRSRSESEGGSDFEKKPEKKLFTEKDLAKNAQIPQEPVSQGAPPKIQEELKQISNQMELEKPQEHSKMEIEKESKATAEGSKEEQDEREEGETKESAVRGRARSGSRSSRSESREERRKKKKDKKHGKKKSRKSDKDKDRKSKKKHRKRSYSQSDSSDEN